MLAMRSGHQIPQDRPREHLATNDSLAEATKNDPVQRATLPGRLRNEERVHQGMHQPVTTQAIHHPAVSKAKQMLHMLVQRHRTRPMTKRAPHAHGEVQGEGFLETPRLSHPRWIA